MEASSSRRIVLFQNIVLSGDSVGTIYLEADLIDLHDRLLRFVVIDFVVLLGSLTVALLLSYRLQRVISEPIRELAQTASSVSAHENYSVRATKRGQDEIGVLFDQFNNMLDRIEQRDVVIQKAHDDLERRVEERTSYLNALIENSPIAILVLDSTEMVQLCNPAFEQMFQYLSRKESEDPLMACWPTETCCGSPRHIPSARSDKAVSMVTRRRRKDQTLVDVELHTVDLVVSGEVVGSWVFIKTFQSESGPRRPCSTPRRQPKLPAAPKASSWPT